MTYRNIKLICSYIINLIIKNMDKTNRGFQYKDFKDCYGLKCSLQQSSSAVEDRIWFGVDESRMHLNQDQVKKLLPYLNTFVETGFLERK